jgi:NTP pyrophosphatase (non-canonical NTP hydrolase)
MHEQTLHTGPINVEFDGTLNGYQYASTSTAVYPGRGSFWGLIYASLQGAAEAGEFAGKTAKLLRDDGAMPYTLQSELNPAKRELMIKEIGDELWYIAAKCNELGVTLENVARQNLVKLADRQARGKLRGSGDER